MRISLVSGVYLDYPIDEAVRRIAAAGFDAIDIWAGRPHVYRRDFSATELQELRRLITQSGLTIASLMPAFYRYPYNLSSTNAIVQQDTFAYMKECLDNAAALGAPIVLIVPKRSLHGQSREDAWKRMLEGIDAVSLYARQYGISLGLEACNAHVTDLVNTAEDALRACRELGHDNLGVVLDTGHIHLSTESAAEAIARCGTRLLQMHVNDNDGKQQQNLIPGDGTFDFAACLASLRQAEYDTVLSAELGYQYTLEPDHAARMTAQRLRALLRRDS
jgi:protein FrlC